MINLYSIKDTIGRPFPKTSEQWARFHAARKIYAEQKPQAKVVRIDPDLHGMMGMPSEAYAMIESGKISVAQLDANIKRYTKGMR